jgi:hypothetical protein
MFMHPNIAGTQFEYSTESRVKIRKKMGFNENDIVAICSTAGNAIWQKDYLIVEHLSKMGIKVINLSNNIKTFSVLMLIYLTVCLVVMNPFRINLIF